MHSRRTSASAGFALALVLAGCVFQPDLGDGKVRCGMASSCPPGKSCAPNGFCYANGQAPAPDLGVDPPLDGGICQPLHCYVGWCGPVSDGCGHTIDCGSCNPGDDPPDMAGGPTDMANCQPRQCVANVICGSAPDGCGKRLDCGDCSNLDCSANKPYQCVCTPKSCADVGAECGLYPNGCRTGTLNLGLLDCFPQGKLKCDVGVCGGGGPYKCGNTFSCNPIKQCKANQCGVIPDGCNSYIKCDDCPSGKICGGGGKPNLCG